MGELVDYKVEDPLTFIVRDRDEFLPDDFLGKVTLPSDSFFDAGFDGELQLSDTPNDIVSFVKVKIELGEKIESIQENVDHAVESRKAIVDDFTQLPKEDDT